MLLYKKLQHSYLEKKDIGLKLLAIFTIILSMGCATTGERNNSQGRSYNSAESNSAEKSNLNPDIDLTSNLRTFSGVDVIGVGQNAEIQIRGGSNSFNAGNQQPLFVVNGNKIMSGYASVYNMVRVADIKSIKILKGGDAGVYGTLGSNGVIIIKTK